MLLLEVPLCQHEFTKPETLHTPSSGDFYGGFIHRHDRSLIPFPAPLPLSREWRVRLKMTAALIASSFPSRSPPCHLIRTKDTVINQEIPRDLGVLYREPGQRANNQNKSVPGALTGVS